MNTKADPVLPIGDKPFWDLRRAEDDESRIKSIAESCVLLQSLKQSRERWLSRTFPKFSSKSRGNKGADVAPPPHTIQTRGRCDLAVGPHTFPETIFYEVHYLPPQASAGTTSNQALPTPYWQSSTSHSSSYTQSAMATSSAPNSQNPNSNAVQLEEKAPTPLVSTLNDTIALTPSLINKVNAAASANPILANLLQLAAGGKATKDQLQTLGLLIQSFANLETLSAVSNPASSGQPQPQPLARPAPAPLNYYQRMPMQSPVKEFDFVVEFCEMPNERWLFPRVPVYGERKIPSDLASTEYNISLLTRVPFNIDKILSNDTDTQYPVTLILKDAPAAVWDTILRWIGGYDKNTANKALIEAVLPPPRLYLGYQLPPGPLVTHLQAACAPPYAMKTLKQGPVVQTRAPRKRTQAHRKEADAAAQVNTKEAPAAIDTVIVKRARVAPAKPAPTPIQCHSCKMTDVPLILGGKFCRPCAEVERQKSTAGTPPTEPIARPTAST